MMITDDFSLEQEVLQLLDPVEDDTIPGRRRVGTHEAALAMLSRCAQTIECNSLLLEEAGSLAATTLGSDAFVVAEKVADRDVLRVKLARPDAPNVAHELEAALCSDTSALGYALEEARPIVISNLRQDGRFTDALFEERQVTSGILCPVGYGKDQFGVLGSLTQRERAFSKEDVLFIQSMAFLLGPAIAHQNAERALAAQSRFLDSTINSLTSMFMQLSSTGEIVRMNDACRVVSGFEAEEVLQRSFCGAFMLPEEAGIIEESMARLREGEPHVRCETFLLSKHSQRRRVAWSMSRVEGELSQRASFIVNGTDITDQFDALAKLSELETALNETDESTGPLASPQVVLGPNALQPEEDESPVVEQRSHRRRAYPYIQAIGPCRGGDLPDMLQFHEVRCRDISPRGFSFLAPEPPDFLELVVTFGAPPSQLFLRARIVHVTPFLHDCRNMMLVGCEYIDRVEPVGQA